MELRVYSAAEVHAALPWPALADALQRAFVAGATESPRRHAHALAPPHDGTLLLMPAWDDAALALKVVTVMPGAAARGAGTVQASVLLLDRATGVPRALIDGEALTLRRTAAVSALAARHLARRDAQRLLVVGAGRLAPWLARAHAALAPRPLRIEVWARQPEAARRVARELADEGLDARPQPDLAAGVAAAALVSCATTSTEPLVRGEWLVPGVHLDLVGGFTRTMREADDAAIARCDRLVVDTFGGALAEAGDLVQPIERGVIARERVGADLAQLLRDPSRHGRRDAAEITLFKSVGAALEDLAAARLVVDSAATGA